MKTANMTSVSTNENTPAPDGVSPGTTSPTEGPRRSWVTWSLGLVAIGAVVWTFQWPHLAWNLEHGFPVSSAKAGAVTVLSIFSVLTDAAVLTFRTIRRPRGWWWAPLVGLLVLVLWFLSVGMAPMMAGVLR